MAVLFVDVHIARNNLNSLEKQLRAAVQRGEFNRGSRIALEYVELIRLGDNNDVEGFQKNASTRLPEKR